MARRPWQLAALVTAVLVTAVIFFLLATLPPRPRPTAWAGDPSIPPRTAKGAYHVHTTRSDGSADRAAVAAAAARAGLDFVIFTDHGDATRTPEPPAYLEGVLCLDGVEISTNGGHYVALDLPPAPYPLGGEPAAVVEDVARLGGFGFAAHADSGRAGLAWTDWSVPVDGVEWLNADSEWRDEPRARLLRALFDYLLRPAPSMAAMLDRPVATLTRWDVLSSRRPIVAIAGHDAHGGIGRGEEGGGWRGVPVPSYEASFRTFATRVVLDAPLSGSDDAADARALLDALRAGRSFTAVDALAGPAYLDLRVSGPRAPGPRPMGSVLHGTAGTLSVDASIPEGGELILLRSSRQAPGAEVARVNRGSYTTGLDGVRGAFRVEVRVPDAPGNPPVPWLVSNPIYFLAPGSGRGAEPSTPGASAGVPIPFPVEVPWHVERDDSSSGSVAAAGTDMVFDFQLGGGERRSQFVALAADLEGGLPAFSRLEFLARASRPMRVSVQVRYPSGGDDRWGRSVYVGTEPEDRVVRIEDLVPMGGQGRPMPPPATARSLLFVIDLTNARPGDSGTLELSGLTFRRD